ncbi:MAG: pseudaminic acid synthase, partial [Planctomycetes bacterium]|nr:pseudaminic acid synthase [Planctomycetota bacterium]
MSANHCGSLEKAIEIIHAAAESGADAIKLQTYKPESLTIDSDLDYFQIKDHPLWKGQSLYQLYQNAHMPWEWHSVLFEEAAKLQLTCFSSPFDLQGVQLLSELNCPAYKIASFEAIDYALIHAIALQKKPVILSTGMCSKEEISDSIALLKNEGINEIALLKCTSAYPAPPSSMNLITINDYQNEFNVLTGLSDHTTGIAPALTAVALGAKVIEKHFVLDHNDPSPDASFSATPGEFSTLVQGVREAEQSLG